MLATILSADEIQDSIDSILSRLPEMQEPVVIVHHGKADAVLLPLARYRKLLDLLEDHDDESDIALGQRLNEERESYATGQGQDFEKFAANLGR